MLGLIGSSVSEKEDGRRKGAGMQQNVEIKRGSTNCCYFHQRERTREAEPRSKAAVCTEQEGMICFDANERNRKRAGNTKKVYKGVENGRKRTRE